MSVWRFFSGTHVDPSNNFIAVANPLYVSLAGPLIGIVNSLSKSMEEWKALDLKLGLCSPLGSLKLSLVEVESDLGWTHGWGIGSVYLPYLLENAIIVSSYFDNNLALNLYVYHKFIFDSITLLMQISLVFLPYSNIFCLFL